MVFEKKSRTHHLIFDRLMKQALHHPPTPTAVVYPLSDVALLGASEAAKAGLISPQLIAPPKELYKLAAELKVDISPFKVIEAKDALDAARKGVALCHDGHCQILMKGSLHSDVFLQPAMSAESGLRTQRRISHAFVLDSPEFERPLILTDAAINIYPKLEEKIDIVQNAIDLAHAIGIPHPRVALLSAIETINPKIVSTLDAAALCKMAQRKQIVGGILDGPLAYDDAMIPEAAQIKAIDSEVAGRADVMVVPDLESGNMLAKQFCWHGNAEAAGVVLGASVPMILTSRADSAKSRLTSAAAAVLITRHSAA
ncbi:MAG: bifunctional enoyl-CoA hydratase/phosphate acetyltransferase [Acidobacteriaceae bacterium]|nr:bifunctional enoyl-CoA hydratase/phosphate acetyltransferase [Acidobacteriaceae bacterium]